jgi:hypothetical protein
MPSHASRKKKKDNENPGHIYWILNMLVGLIPEEEGYPTPDGETRATIYEGMGTGYFVCGTGIIRGLF